MKQHLLVALGVAALAASPIMAQDNGPTPAKPFSAEEEAHYLDLGKRITGWMLGGQADSVLATMSAETVERSGGLDGIRRMMDQLAERAGMPLTVHAEKMTRRNGLPQFWYEADFSNFTDEPIVLRWVFDADGKLTGMGMGPKSRAPYDGKP